MSKELSRATRRRQSRLSPIWIVPLVAVLIGVWMVYDSYASRGPIITIFLDNAEGIEAGKTLVKARNVEVGRVESVQLSEDFSHAIVRAAMSEDSERMLNSGTRFWVVKPRIDREGISGLGTVLSGAYIQLLPGAAEEPQLHFEALDSAPVAPPNAEGLRISLVSQLGNSLNVGDPVTYQGFVVGRVETTEFEPETRQMHHGLYIEEPYGMLITETTRFWTASGINLRLDSEGFNVQVESLETLIGGGASFGVPEEVALGEPVGPGHRFTLYPDSESARQGTYDRYLEYVLLVDGTVRGLSPGAPVEYRGVRVGTVANVPWHFTAPQPEALTRFAIPVLIHFEPQRFEDIGNDFDMEEWESRLQRMFDYGLRASLKTGNYVTQALYVDLSFMEEAPEYQVKVFEGETVFPTVPGGLSQITEQITALLDKLNSLQIEPILTSLNSNLKTSEATLEEVRAAAVSLQALLEGSGAEDIPANVNDTLAELRSTLQGFSPESPAYQEMIEALGSLQSLLNDLRPVAQTLREKPNALIFNGRGTEDPQPRAPE